MGPLLDEHAGYSAIRTAIGFLDAVPGESTRLLSPVAATLLSNATCHSWLPASHPPILYLSFRRPVIRFAGTIASCVAIELALSFARTTGIEAT